MEKLTLTAAVVQQIQAISAHCPTEIGGLLIGTVKQPVVALAGEPGPKAVLRPSSFSTDPEHDRQLLNRTRKQYNGRVTALGYWHKHPAGMSKPSGGDLAQAQALLANLTGDDNPWVLAFIVDPAHPAGKNIFPYILEPPGNGFRLLRVEVVDERSPAVQRALAAEPVYAFSEEGDSFWGTLDFRFQRTPAGLQRLRQEKAQLEAAGYRVKVTERNDDRRISLRVEKGNASWLCLPPPEYPLSMPRIYRLPHLTEEFPFQSRPVWNSDITLADCLSVLTAQQEPARVNGSSAMGNRPVAATAAIAIPVAEAVTEPATAVAMTAEPPLVAAPVAQVSSIEEAPPATPAATAPVEEASPALELESVQPAASPIEESPAAAELAPLPPVPVSRGHVRRLAGRLGWVFLGVALGVGIGLTRQCS